jgi:folate-binding protein YgfZ
VSTTSSNSAIAGVETVRKHVGLWSRDDYTFVRFTGPDVASWLQTQTTNDVLALQSGEGHANALLDRKGRLQAHFTLHRWEDEYWLIVEKSQAARLLQQLDDHLFLEKVEWADSGDEVEQLLVQGPRSLLLLGTVLGDAAVTQLPREPYACAPLELAGFQVLCFQVSVTGEDGFLLIAQASERQALMDALLAAGEPLRARLVDESAREALRIEAGLPRFDIDMDTNYRIPETTLEREAVSYSKGCYLGQEVVARLKAYASPKQALMGLVFDADARMPEFDSPIYDAGKQIGVVKSAAFSPTLSRPIALAYLDREHRAPGLELSNGGEVVMLPFYRPPSRHERARILYEMALELFEHDLRDEDDTDIHFLKEAVLLDPAYEDAFEALGVILHRHGHVDEAIHYMKILEALNPNCVMAHTNLSVFYVAKGMIEDAETEKAKAAVLQIRKSSEARKAEEMAAAERERIRREALERIEMFKEVLEIDPDDPLATFGMGVAHIQLDEYDKAIPFLEQATRVSKDYSAAYLQLGKCLEFTKQYDLARDAFRKGIEVATRKGDLMPLREMERRLNSLPVTSD